MTAPNGPILFNNSTGSDTQSSGLGPSTALYGAGASTTAASAVVTGINTTGVSAGDLLWVQSSSDRQFSIIASVDSSTQVTCDDVFANTESGRTWACGGKRATFEDASSRRIFAEDVIFMCRVETETDQALTSALGRSGATVKIKATGPDRKTMTISGVGNTMFRGGWFRLQNFKLEALDNNDISYNDSSDATVGTTVLRFQDCVVGDPTNSFSQICNSPSGGRVSFLQGTVVQNISLGGLIAPRDKLAVSEIDGTLMKECGKFDRYGDRTGFGITYSIFIGTGSNSVVYQRYLGWNSYKSIYYNLGNVVTGSAYSANFYGDLFHTISNPSAANFYGMLLNSYQYNRTGSVVYSNLLPELNELTTLSEDPCENASMQDFNINRGGAVLRANKNSP